MDFDKKYIFLIKEEVPVQYDKTQQTPLGFQWRGHHHEVLKPLHLFINAQGHIIHLLLTNRGTFCLSFVREHKAQVESRSRWILKYRLDIKRLKKQDHASYCPEDLKPGADRPVPRRTINMALVPLRLANVVYYHGHLCPELAVGYRAALVAEREMGLCRDNATEFYIYAENMSSAIEALQLMTGCSIGNQNFFAYDLGKHVYYFGRINANYEPGQALRLALVNRVVNLETIDNLDRKISTGQATGAEHDQYSRAIDTAVQEILDLPEEQLFAKKWVLLHPPRASKRISYTKCSSCGEIVSLDKSVPGKEGLYCRVCAAKTN